MIRQETAAKIWNCYREINLANELINKLEQAIANQEDLTPEDWSGRRRGYQLGVPTPGGSGHSLYDVEPDLALAVMRSHVADQQAKLKRANEQARLELDQS